MSTIKVAILGATGETGGSIIEGLLASTTPYEVTALVRPASLKKPKTSSLKSRGIKIKIYDVASPIEEQTQALGDIDVLIATVSIGSILDQIPLATAAKRAGVKRFVPSFFSTITPPKGIIAIRDEKEEVLCHVKKLGLGFTVIDVGWWIHGFIPQLPSGRTDYIRVDMLDKPNLMPGDGNVPTALTDPESVGRVVARIIADPRTLNKMVFMCCEVATLNQIYDLVEKLSGESFPRHYVNEPVLLERIDEARRAVSQNTANIDALLRLNVLQYYYSCGVRGDNTPEYAEYLGYLEGKDLYPELKLTSIHDFFKTVLDGKARRPHSD